jgi:hypothetical protein
VREHALKPSDRAALQSLITLAGTLGAGTIFALFFSGRKRAEYAVFEVFAVAAVLASLASTAYFAVALLHQNEAITDRELAETATPLIVATFLLVLISVFARLPGSVERAVTLLPLALAAVLAAVELGSTTWTVTPDNAFRLAVAILVVGLLVAALVWAGEKGMRRSTRRSHRRRLAEFGRRGFVPAAASLAAAVPGLAGPVILSGWERKGRLHLDVDGAIRLARAVDSGWDGLGGESCYPSGSPLLVAVEAPTAWRYLRGQRDLRFVLVEPAAGGGERVETVERLEHGLFDVTDLARLG